MGKSQATGTRKTVAEWHEDLILKRLSLSAAITADIWATIWWEANHPSLCWTWDYALKPSFISPTDEACFGYATAENPNGFLKKDGTSALPWKKPEGAPCVTF